MKTIVKYFFIVLVSLMLFFLANKYFLKLKEFEDFLSFNKEIKIDETPIIINKIKAIAEVATVKLVAEVLVDSVKPCFSNGISFKQIIAPITNAPCLDKIVVIAKGEVIAGINFSNLAQKNIVAKNDTLFLTIPQATFIDVLCNPSDTQIFHESGSWPSQTLQNLQNKIRVELINKAINLEILKQANNRAENLLIKLTMSMGFKSVSVNFKN